jgi:hypothetical protein
MEYLIVESIRDQECKMQANVGSNETMDKEANLGRPARDVSLEPQYLVSCPHRGRHIQVIQLTAFSVEGFMRKRALP